MRRRLGVALALILVAGMVAGGYWASGRWAADRVGDVAIPFHDLTLGSLKKTLGERYTVAAPGKSETQARLERKVTILGMDVTPESGMFVFGPARDQTFVAFGSFVQAGYFGTFDDPARLDAVDAVWIRVARPFKGSLLDIHIGDRVDDAKARLSSMRVGQVSNLFSTASYVVLRFGTYTGARNWIVTLATDGSNRVSAISAHDSDYQSVIER